jgi:hypothetical protein
MSGLLCNVSYDISVGSSYRDTAMDATWFLDLCFLECEAYGFVVMISVCCDEKVGGSLV